MKVSHKPADPIERAKLRKARSKRRVARELIIKNANRYAAQRPRHRAPYSGKDLQRCVSICRRFGLVSDEVLADAGFNPRPANKRKVVPLTGTRTPRRKHRVRRLIARARRRP